MEIKMIDLNSEDDRLKVWQKAQKVEGYNPSLFRKDCCGAWMAYVKYGDTSNPYGWEIDHVYPQARGGDDRLENLRAMNWRNNRSKGDDYPSYKSAVGAEDNKNIKNEDVFTVNSDLQAILKNIYD